MIFRISIRALLSALSILALLAGAHAAEVKSPTRSDAEALLKNVKTPPGFKVTLFAAPPEVSYPVCLAAAVTGEVFIGIDENGSLGTKPNRGRILRCIDTDGDGHADKFTVFANVDSPRGLWHDNGTLYVLHPPFLHAYHDDDGDGVADRSEQLVEGLGFTLKTRGADHTINGIQMGIDGWLYIAAGDYGFVNAIGKDGKVVKLLGGGVARVRSDGTELEIFANGLRNIYDVAIDPELDLFTRDNTNDGGGWDVRLSHIFSSAHYGYPTLFKNFSNEIVQPLADYGGGSPTGSLFLSEPGFPEGFGDTLYTCDWGRSIVYRHPLSRQGAGFSAQQVPFVEIARPTDMDVDGQSRIYISSWKDGGFDFSKPDVGFVVRVTPPDYAKGSQVPVRNLNKASDGELLQTLGSASHVWRLHAQRELLRRGPKPDIIADLEKLAETSSTAGARVAAIFTLKQLQGPQSHPALLRLAKNDLLRETALRALADRRSELSNLSTATFSQALTDKNPRVRLQAAIALGRLGRSESGEALIAATEDSDLLVAHAAVNALVNLRAVGACLSALDYRRASWSGASRALQSMHERSAVEGLLSCLSKQVDPELQRLLLTALCRLAYREAEYTGSWWGTRPDTTGPYFKAVQWDETERILAELSRILKEGGASTKKFLLMEMARHRIKTDETAPMLLEFASEDPAFVPTAVNLLSGRSGLPKEAIPLFARVAASAEFPAATRARAIGALQRCDDEGALDAAAEGLIASALQGSGNEELSRARESFIREGRQARNISTFVKWANDPDAARRELAYAVLVHLSTQKQKDTRDTASAAVERAFGRAGDIASLLRVVGQTRAEQFSYQVRSHLNDTDSDVRRQARYAARELKLDRSSSESETGPLIDKLPYEQILSGALKEKGDVRTGSHLFVRQGCVACHTVSPKETPKGPFLGDIATRYTRAEIIESILKPSAKVAQGFVSTWFEMHDGSRYDGFIVRESGDEIEIRNVAGIATVLSSKDILKRGQLDTSIMPEGLVNNVTVADLASLLSYLESLKAQ